jgi:hypothetical protein
MNVFRTTLTRRTALSGSTAGLALAAVGWWFRSSTRLAAHPQAALSEAPVPALTSSGAPVAPEAAAVPAAASAASPAAVTAGPRPVLPAGGAGLFDVDPDQSGVNQDPHVEVSSDVSALPLDMEF